MNNENVVISQAHQKRGHFVVQGIDRNNVLNNLERRSKDEFPEVRKENMSLYQLFIELKNKLDKQKEINILLFLILLKSQKHYGLTEINVDDILNQAPEELKSKVEHNPEVAKELSVVTARVYLALKEKEYLGEDSSKEKDQLQLLCYAIEEYSFDSVRVNDLDIPYHPLEAKLLKLIDAIDILGDMPKNVSPLSVVNFTGKPNHYTPRHKLGAVGFLKEEYKEYLEQNVIYQDMIRKIDPLLYRALRNAIKNQNGVSSSEELEKIIPTKKARSRKNKCMLDKSKSLTKAYRIKNLSYRS